VGGGWGGGGGVGESDFESSSRQFVEFLDGMLQGVPVDAGVVGEGVGPVAGERKLAVWRDEYRKDAILGVSLCFRCSLHIGVLLCCGWYTFGWLWLGLFCVVLCSCALYCVLCGVLCNVVFLFSCVSCYFGRQPGRCR